MKYKHFLLGASCLSLSMVLLVVGSVLLSGCSSSVPKEKLAQFRFVYDGHEYRIQSISSPNPDESFNRLIGKNFLAVDYDKDQIIDHVLIGNIEFSDVQKIYDFGIQMAIKEDRLLSKSNGHDKYRHENHDYSYELSSYKTNKDHVFNELKVIDKRRMFSYDTAILLDSNADGILDRVLRGSVSLEKIQQKYSEIIQEGLDDGKLVMVDNHIIVKKQ